MHITIGVKHGVRRELLPLIKVEGLARVEQQVNVKWYNRPSVRAALGFAIPVALMASGFPPLGITHAFASAAAPDAVMAMGIPDVTKQMILKAFDPLIDLIQSLAYPIAGVMIAGGCLFVMIGNRDRGMQMLQNAAIGYILVQLSPVMLKLLVGIGSGM